MKALSIRQPWAWAILHAGKRVENRDWRAPPSFRGTFLIHASSGCTKAEFFDGARFMLQRRLTSHGSLPNIPALREMPRGAIVGRATLADVILPGGVYSSRCYPSNPAHRADSPWYVGALGLLLADVERIVEPIALRGALGFFEVPDALLVGAQWERVP